LAIYNFQNVGLISAPSKTSIPPPTSAQGYMSGADRKCRLLIDDW